FLNSDDTGLTTNVFLTEPRLYGVRVTKDWTGGGAWWSSLIGEGSGPYPLTVEVGGGVSRFEADNEDYHPAWMDEYSDAFPMPDVQNDELDWNGDKEARLTYRPGAGSWKITAGYRFGRTNGSELMKAYEAVTGGTAYFFGQGIYFPSPDNHLRGSVRDQEEFSLIDFMVGKEVGFGSLSQSSFSAGVRYAEFGSTSKVLLDGVPNRYVPTTWNLYPTTPPQPERSHYHTSLDSDREFEGYGPQLSWEAAVRLWGDDTQGHADLDWTVSGGVLFGKQRVASVEDQVGILYTGGIPDETANDVVNDFFLKYEDIFADRFVPRTREDDVTAPTLGVSLGLSYEVQRVKVSTGYRYDRFFDVIDGGYEDASSKDRVVHGPYLKLAIGFGG
ncbi:MAG TPA: Lpg1974 family pore-forming outer membrane protein, partial [Caulobacteraceae bacterium]